MCDLVILSCTNVKFELALAIWVFASHEYANCNSQSEVAKMQFRAKKYVVCEGKKKMAENTSKDEPAASKRLSRLARKRKVIEEVSEDVADDVVQSQDARQEGLLSDKMKNKRRANWTPRETRVLIQSVMENYEVLFGNHGGSARSESDKARVWITVRDAVNA